MVVIRIATALTALCCAVAGAHAQPAAAPEKAPAPSAVAAPAGAGTAPNYVLAPNDLLEIKVFQESELDTTARISADGKLNLPLIGELAMGGKTVQQGTRLIRDRLEARFLVDPQVTIRVIEPAKRLFTVLGQVQRPGTYRFPDRETLNLIQVIGVAGGYSRLAAPSRVTVKRVVDGKESVFRLDAKRMASDSTTKAFEIAPGDIITIGERFF